MRNYKRRVRVRLTEISSVLMRLDNLPNILPKELKHPAKIAKETFIVLLKIIHSLKSNSTSSDKTCVDNEPPVELITASGTSEQI